MVTFPVQWEWILWDAPCLNSACQLEVPALPGELPALRCPQWSVLMVTFPAQWEWIPWDALCLMSACQLMKPVMLFKFLLLCLCMPNCVSNKSMRIVFTM